MSEFKRDPLDAVLGAVSREVQPEQDLWPKIRDELERAGGGPAARLPGRLLPSRWFQLAASVLLVLASSVTTYVLTRQSMQEESARIAQQTIPSPLTTATPASFGFVGEALGQDYLRVRTDLDKVFKERVAALPQADRAKLERNLADLRQAVHEISVTLAEHPSDPLLQDLLMSTYQSELDLLAGVSELPTASSMRVDL